MEIDRSPVSPEKADLDQAPVQRERLQVPREVVPADDVENDVYPSPGRFRAHDLCKILSAVIDGERRAKTAACVTLFIGARGCEHDRVEGARELDGGRTDAARPAMNECSLGCAKASPLKKIRPDRKERFGNGGRRHRVHSVGKRQALHGWCRAYICDHRR